MLPRFSAKASQAFLKVQNFMEYNSKTSSSSSLLANSSLKKKTSKALRKILIVRGFQKSMAKHPVRPG